jgi:AraC-like DNA-binding protein
VLPDGCCDLILRVAPGQSAQWFISALADSAYGVECAAGERFQGWRFHPGARVDEAGLMLAISQCQPLDEHGVLALIDNFVRLDGRIAEALESLCGAPDVASATRQLGVSERSLERLVRAGTGRTPGYWKSLARIRRAARALSGRAALADIAADHGYADQAHMSREFRRWFGLSPSGFQASPVLPDLVAQAGYG